MLGIRIAILMPSLVQAKKIHLQLLHEELDRGGEFEELGGHVRDTDLRITFPGGSWIQFVSQEAVENARGLRCDVLWVDEADDIRTASVDAVALPWFSEPHSLKITVIGGTPKCGRYGLLYRTHARALGKLLDTDGNPFTNHFSFHATAYDFPRYVDPAAVAKARRETSSTLFAREWLCDFDAAEGLVYGVFDTDFHVRPVEPETIFEEVIVGCDYGWEDPNVFLLLGAIGHGRDMAVHVFEEHVASHRDEDAWVAVAQGINARFPEARWYHDPSMPSRIAALKRKAGVSIKGAKNARDEGINAVGNMLAVRTRTVRDEDVRHTRLYVSPACTQTIREMGLYRRRRDPKDPERILDEVIDRDDHCMDALRYGLFSRFGSVRTTVDEHDGGEYGWG